MRNFFKPTTRGANARSRRPLRGVAAAVASVALVAGLGSYPGEVSAQESLPVSPQESTVATTALTTTAPATTTVPSTSAAIPTTQAPTSSPVSVKRSGDIDRIVVDDQDGVEWGYGSKASDEDIFAIKRIGDGSIEEIVKVVIDGKTIEPEYYGFVNNPEGGYLAFDLDALTEIPPRNVVFEVRTTGPADYRIAENFEVPSARDLSESGYGRNPNANATVNPEGVGQARVAVPGYDDTELGVSGLQTTFVNGNPELKFQVNRTSPLDRYFRLTRFVVKKDRNDSNTKSIAGPVRVRVIRNGRTVQDRVLDRLDEVNWGSNARNQSYNKEFKVVPNVKDFRIEHGDTIILNPQGPPNGNYQVQVWGERRSACPSESAVVAPLGPREVTPAEIASGTRKFVSTSEDASGGTSNRNAMIRTVLNLQNQGNANFQRLGTSNWIHNGLAYNPDDNWLYAVSQYRGDQPDCYPAAHLLQVDPTTGSVRNLGPLTGVTLPMESATSNNDRELINSGVIHNGTLFVSNSATSGTRQMYKIPLPGTQGFQAGLPRIEKMTRNGSPVWARAEDYAQVREDPKYAWGLVSKHAFDPGWNLDGANTLVIQRINLETGETDHYSITGDKAKAPNGEVLTQQTTWGKAWTYGNGNLGFGVGGQANAGFSTVQIQVDNPSSDTPSIHVVQLLPKAPFSYNTDAASDGLRNPPPASDLKIVKKTITPDDPDWAQLSQLPDFNEYSTYWKVVVENGDSFNSGSTLMEYLPSIYDPDNGGFQLVGTSASEGQSQNIHNPGSYKKVDGGSVFQIGLPVMKPNSTLSMYWRAKAFTPDAFAPNREFARQGCAPNSVELINNDEEINPDDKKSTSSCPGEIPKFDFNIKKVDASGGASSLSGAEFVIVNAESDAGGVAPADNKDLDRSTWPNNKKVILLTEGTGDEKGFYTPEQRLRPDTPYRLYEARSPLDSDGRRYSLLTQPVVFRVKAEGDKQPSIEFYDEQRKTWSTARPTEVTGISVQENTIIMGVANVRQGNLPKTGGIGIGVTTVLGLLIVAAGGLIANKRRRA